MEAAGFTGSLFSYFSFYPFHSIDSVFCCLRMDTSKILDQVDHRPWPLPNRPCVMTQTWRDLLFAHWPLPPKTLRPLVPKLLRLDTFDGEAWLGVTPFQISGFRLRYLPAVPGLSSFPEVNVRTYAVYEDKPGVFFFSLDAGSLAAVIGARLWYRLPYYYARMSVRVGKTEIRYSCQRRQDSAEFAATYHPVSTVRPAWARTLEHWLTERYCLYAVERGRVYRAHIHHLPWPLQEANAEIQKNTMAAASQIALPKTKPLLHFARELKTYIWAPEELSHKHRTHSP